METNYTEEERYYQAQKRVEEIRKILSTFDCLCSL